MKKGILIGISGASGCGKSLLSNTIINEIGNDKVIMLTEDSYYKDLKHIPFSQRETHNFDHPNSFDHRLLFEHISQLLNGHIIEQPIYNFKEHYRMNETKKFGPHSIIILEGILIFSEKYLRDLMDIKIYIDTPLDICFIRRLKRDMRERGRSLESIVDQYVGTVKPMFHQFIEPSKKYADIIIPHGGKNIIGVDIIKTKINQLLNTYFNKKK